MRNASGKYRTKVQYLIFMVALLISIALNIDSIQMFKTFYNDDITKGLILKCKQDKIDVVELEGIIDRSLPIGWDKNEIPNVYSLSFLTVKIIGFIISCIMISISAILIFSLLNKYVNVRGVKSPYYG
jgi:hypothetical protein